MVAEFMHIRCSIVVSISACHTEDPGSIPGRGVFVASRLDVLVAQEKSKRQTLRQIRKHVSENISKT